MNKTALEYYANINPLKMFNQNHIVRKIGRFLFFFFIQEYRGMMFVHLRQKKRAWNIKWEGVLKVGLHPAPLSTVIIELFWFDTPYYVAVLKILTCLYTICGGINMKHFISTPDKDNLGTLINLSSDSSAVEDTEHSEHNCFNHHIQDTFIQLFLHLLASHCRRSSTTLM